MTNPKLSRRLKRALLATLMAVLVLATAAAGVSAYFEASEVQDETLFSVARLIETNQMGLHRDVMGGHSRRLDDNAIGVWKLGDTSRHGFKVKKALSQGFQTLFERDDFWRVYVTASNQGGDSYVVAQRLSVSTEIALTSALNTALPILVLFLLVPLLISIIVRHSFRPLNQVTRELEDTENLSPDLASNNNIPVEVMPFISAIELLLKKNADYNSRQQRFIADAAHELRTPITALTLEIENLNAAKSPEIKEQRQQALSRSISRLQRLVNQLLDLARAQSCGDAVRSTVRFDDIIKSQIGDLFVLAEEKAIDFTVNKLEPLSVEDANHQLQHIVRNALSNAIKFTPPHGSITICLTAQKQQAVLVVSDTGIGVKEEEFDKLHQAFFSSTNNQSELGAGLGLAICYEIAAHLGGEIQLCNVLPQGFKFTYQQPIVDLAHNN